MSAAAGGPGTWRSCESARKTDSITSVPVGEKEKSAGDLLLALHSRHWSDGRGLLPARELEGVQYRADEPGGVRVPSLRGCLAAPRQHLHDDEHLHKALTSAKREAQSRVVDVLLDRSRNVAESAGEGAA
jgi:hypothetical protein